MIIYEIPLQLTPISLNTGRKLKTQIHAFTKTLKFHLALVQICRGTFTKGNSPTEMI